MIRSTTRITLDVSRPNVAANVYAVSDDQLSRWVEATIVDGSMSLTIPSNVAVLIRYRKPDGTAGLYDTLEDGSSAYTISGNVITLGLAAQMLTVAGVVNVEVHIYTEDEERLTSFRFALHVSADVISDATIVSSDYYNVMTATVAEMQNIARQVRAAYGAPRVAHTAAEMTDHTFVYVYVGHETGYVNGDWYYWDGSAWADGGTYNSTAFDIDETLTISGDPADAKKTGQLGAPEYSASLGYQVGEVVLYNGTLYRCVSAITTPEAFTAAHWAALNLGNGSTAGGDALYETAELSASGAADAYYGTPASVTIPLKRGWNVNTGNGSLITGSSTTETAVSEPVRGDRYESVTVKAGYKVSIFGNDLGPGHAVRGVTSAYQGSASADTVVRLGELIPAAHCSWLWFVVKKYSDGDIRSDTAASTALTAAAYPIRDKTADRLDTLEGVDIVQAPVVLKGKNVVVFGDSIPAGVYSTGASTTEISWTKSWAYLLCTSGGAAAIDNQTVSGSRFLTLSDSDTSILNKIRFYSGTADVVIVSGGVNDWISLSPLGKYSDGAGNYGTSFYAAVRLACDTIRVGFPGAQVIFVTPLTVCDNAGNLHTSGAGENIPLSRYRRAIYELASYNGFTVIDGSDLGFPRRQGGYQNEVTKDGLHPTIKGHEMLAAVIANRLGLHSISIDTTLTQAGQAAEAKAVGDIFDAITYVVTDTETVVQDLTLTWSSGYVDPADGQAKTNANLEHSNSIPVNPGDIVKLGRESDGANINTIRFLAVFKNGVVQPSLGGDNVAAPFTVPEGADSIIISISSAYGNATGTKTYTVTTATVEPILKPKVDALFKIAASQKPSRLEYAFDLAANGSYASVEQFEDMCGYRICFDAKLSSFSGETKIGKGIGQTYGAGIGFDNANLYEYFAASGTPARTQAHGLTLKDYVSLVIDVPYSKTITVTLSTNGGQYKWTVPVWRSYYGALSVSTGAALTDCKLSYACEGVNTDNWIYGDSYAAFQSNDRWTYYLVDTGHQNYLLNGYPGRNSVGALASLKIDLALNRVPRRVLWIMGMNDKDTDSAPNANWQSSVEEVMQICTDNHIELILATIPNVPATNTKNTFKNAYVVASGYRYIDFANAVSADGSSTWYDGMLFTDNVHPDVQGALALYNCAVTEVPELLI